LNKVFYTAVVSVHNGVATLAVLDWLRWKARKFIHWWW